MLKTYLYSVNLFVLYLIIFFKILSERKYINYKIDPSCCALSIVLNSLMLTSIVSLNAFSCNLQFALSYIPSYFGSSLTLMVASIRYLLSNKAAKNLHPSKFKISLVSYTTLGVLAFAYSAYVIGKYNPKGKNQY